MLDIIHDEPKRTAEWQTHLTWGDIVSFRFPILTNPVQGREPKKRPCLVIDRTLIGAIPFVTIAYGTSQDGGKSRGYDLAVTSPASIRAAGLHKPTRFQCARQIRVHLNHSGFIWLASAKSPVIGALQGEEFDAMNRIRTRLQAEADIAADRRQRRRLYGRRPFAHRPGMVTAKSVANIHRQ
ncbi:type II toxin-antitoxin system PemK/MazF family toxin [Shimia sagamensis]|uniref:PemK-like protein n=1 Tax=Shimia sagamensis TaxID=1566352 RepID=A0ABY1NR32_9RHOB|nr:type II toxin-antitoxin system PemK/MazF family toxin [Shimia sagamensis]SMP16012.1 hypothetical protein SAMN06265373_1035 [Shimia sagamensis]